MMRKVLLLIGILVLGLEASVFAAALDAPHNQTNAFICNDCHSFGVDPLDDACLSCHINATGAGYSKANAPKMLTHSSDNTSTKYGTWSQLCRDCHQPHTQNQREVYGAATYLVTGTITSVTRNLPLNQVTYGYNNMTALKPEWADFTKWGRKSANNSTPPGNERGLILFPSVANVGSILANFGLSAEIISATATSITVQGYPGTVAVGSSFALIYGQHLSTVVGAGGLGVKFFNNTGLNSFAYDESGTGTDPTPDGVCQVCHTKTQHWRTDGTLAANHNSGKNCITCHKHEEGFKANCDACHGTPPITNTLGGPNGLVNNPAPTGDTSAGAHVKHATTGAGDYGFACEKCHSGGMPASAIPDMTIEIGFSIGAAYQSGTYDGRALPLPNGYTYAAGNAGTIITNTGTQTCTNIYCHSNAKVGTSVQAYATPAWTGAPLDCTACHGYPPAYANGGAGTATANSHVPHVTTNGFGCQLCHNKTTTDGTTIADVTMHANTNIDVFFDSSNPSGTYTAATKTCSTTVCHGAGAPQWGGSVKCQDCHLDTADLDNFTGTFWNNGTVGKIGSTEWSSTGHGLASGAYASGNPAAGFTTANACTFCHDNTVGHKDSTNPFRLRNITDAKWGKNGACQLCHAAGSAGVTVDSVAKNGTKKIGSTHYGTKHNVTLSGGQFCWDCHDPHGDSNIFMVHASVAMTSDATTGAPTASVATTFTAFATGTDYAKSTAPFNGICQVCHTTTSHYTSSSGDGHNSGSRCTGCHQHSGDTTTNAFRPSGCDTCHGNPPINNSTAPTPTGVPNYGLVNNPAPTGSTSAGVHARHAASGAGDYGFVCEKCHTGGMPASAIPDMKIEIGFNITTSDLTTQTYDGRTLPLPNGYSYQAGNGKTIITNNGNQTCTNIYCHSNAKIGTPVQTFATPKWTDGPLGCTACHGFPPSYPNGGAGTPTANTHVVHVINNGFGCQICHNKTVSADGSYNVAFHDNTNIDVFFDATNPNGTYTAATKTCSNVTACHGTGAPQWGGTVQCQDCHLGATDADNLITWNNGKPGIIGADGWISTGHGLSTGTYASGNPAAGFTGASECAYCHDSSVAHLTPTNPFRLRNFSDPTWGKNGACQGCHATGSSGVMAKNGTRKVGSTHYGTKHNITANGGQFCWDCHDPHGDNNIFMVHATVAKTSDVTTGAPITNAQASFTAFATGTDYAGGSNSIKICNTCHTSTNHYTSTTSDTHNSTIRCTNCHKHTDPDGTITAGFKPFGNDCFDCHSSSGGSTPGTAPDANHAKHVKTAFVGKVSLGDYGNSAKGWYSYSNIGGVPDMGCGYCHPQSSATHMNGVINLNFDPNDSGAAGTLKAKNGLPQTFTQNTRVNVTCSSVYCHSDGHLNGSSYGYKTTPNWYGGSYTGDKCSGCHTNSPAGSQAHGAHVVGIHFADIYKGPGSDSTGGGFATAGNTNTSSHGNALTSTTINCNVCHNNTVTMSGNDLNTVCATCHTGANLKGTMVIDPASTTHVNGTVDVAFNPIQVLSKAQLRDDITTVPELDNNWTRTGGYKIAGSDDAAKTALNSGVMFNSSTKTCSNIACHNGNSVRWTDSISCESCHTALPQ